jgi:acyl-CoA synthetase (AMP-forming)/AMP-acid ligase II
MTRSAHIAPAQAPRTLAELLDRAAAAAPHRRLLTAPDAELSFTRGELREAVAALRTAILHAGVRPGERVGILLEWSEPRRVAPRGHGAGATAVPLHPRLAPGELAAAPSPPARPTSSRIASTARSPRPSVSRGGSRPSSSRRPAHHHADAPAAPALAPGEVPALVLFTSGTTGTEGRPAHRAEPFANAAQVASRTSSPRRTSRCASSPSSTSTGSS